MRAAKLVEKRLVVVKNTYGTFAQCKAKGRVKGSRDPNAGMRVQRWEQLLQLSGPPSGHLLTVCWPSLMQRLFSSQLKHNKNQPLRLVFR